MKRLICSLALGITALSISGCGASAGSPPKDTQKAFVRKVMSGDTLMIQQGTSEPMTVRLYGIDAPELGQPYVGRAHRRLRELSTAKQVEFAVPAAADAAPDEILLYIDGELTNATLLTEGLAWVTPGVQQSELVDAFSRAKRNKRGLWKDSRQIPPWEFRSMRSAEQQSNTEKRVELQKKEAPSVINYNSVEGMDKPAYPYYWSKSRVKKYNDNAAKSLNKHYKHWKSCSGSYCFEKTPGGGYRKYKRGQNDKSSYSVADPKEKF